MQEVNKDQYISKIFWILISIILLIWVVQIGIAFYHTNSGSINLYAFFWEYIHFILLVYISISVQVAGYIELQKRQHYMPAFFLTLILTPLGSFLYYYFKIKKSQK